MIMFATWTKSSFEYRVVEPNSATPQFQRMHIPAIKSPVDSKLDGEGKVVIWLSGQCLDKNIMPPSLTDVHKSKIGDTTVFGPVQMDDWIKTK